MNMDTMPSEDEAVSLAVPEVPAATPNTVIFSHHDDSIDRETNGNAERSHDDSAQDDAIRALLATADQRQKAFQDIRETSMMEPGVRDDRRCDYPLQPVLRVASARRSAGSRRGSRGVPVALEDAKQANRDVKVEEPAPAEADLVWRCHLQAHVAQLLMELRNRPQDLQGFLASHYPKGDANEDSSDDEDDNPQELEAQAGDASKERPSVYESSPAHLQRHVHKCLSVQDVYKRLTEIGFQLGERLYHRLRAMLLKSVATGVIDRASNVIRLESMFKLEIRRNVTIDTMRGEISAKQADHHKRKRKQRLARLKKRSTAANDARDADSSSKSDDPHHEEVSAMEEASSAHHFKMLALERVIAADRKQGGITNMGFSQRVMNDQLEEQMHEKVTAMLYNKNRDSFPFWKDPPENALSREETAKVLRVVVGALLLLPVFRTLTIDQLLEMARASRWKTVAQDHIVCAKNDVIDHVIVVMDGRVGSETTHGDGGSNRQAQLQRVTSRMDDRRSVDSQQESMKENFGELGLLTKNESWTATLRVITAQAKLLVLTRDSFDAVLMKIFGGFKRQSAHAMKRPNSSPAVTRVSSRLPPGAGLASPRPSTAAKAREEAVSKFRRFRDEQLTPSVDGDDIKEALAQETQQPDTSSALKSNHGDRMGRNVQPRTSTHSVYQHYPSFTSSTTTSAGSHLFRLKCIQPIAFGMKPMEDLIHDEWAPAFPDTCTLVDFLGTTETNFLFDKRNVLLKANLRAVCTNIPFQEVGSRADENFGELHGDTPAADGLTLLSEPAMSSSSAAQTSAAGVTMIPVSEGDPMTLGQFAEARKRMFGKHGASFSGGQSPSVRNLFGSSATSATLAKNGNAPFTNSSFVPEASFTDDIRSKYLTGVGDEEVEEDDEDIFEVPVAQSQDRKASTLRPQRPEVDDNESGDSEDENDKSDMTIDVSPTPTRARKSALDSLIQTMVSPARKKSMIDQEAARRIILQKHLQAAKEEPASGRRKSSVMGSDPAANAANLTDASNAPLPLRVDLQRRMEVVLAALKMKPKTKLDLVLKYTHADFYELFPDAVVLWEQALHYIQKREKALHALRQFELVASDPRRHFRSLSTHRLTEQKERDALFYQLNYASDLCRESLDELEIRCNDVVYFEARLYRDKMKKDYTELLYDVEQERLRMIYKNVHPSTKPPATLPMPNNINGSITPSQAPASMKSARYALTTPRENIYVSVLDHKRTDERQERERAELQEEELQQKKRHHNLSAQVKQHRQAQLEAMQGGRAIPPTSNQGTPRPKPKRSDDNGVQVRTATSVENVSSITQLNKMASLKNALERALGGR